MRYNVTVDYVTTTRVPVDARDEDQAFELVSDCMRTTDGAKKLLKLMADNTPDGFDIPLVEKAGEHSEPPMLWPKKPKLVHEFVDKWENHDDESQCPFCGEAHSYERREEDDGYDWNGHWIAFRFACNECGGEWWATYYLADASMAGFEIEVPDGTDEAEAEVLAGEWLDANLSRVAEAINDSDIDVGEVWLCG